RPSGPTLDRRSHRLALAATDQHRREGRGGGRGSDPPRGPRLERAIGPRVTRHGILKRKVAAPYSSPPSVGGTTAGCVGRPEMTNLVRWRRGGAVVILAVLAGACGSS